MSTSTGETLAGRYRLLRVVGSGGMGAVWAAHDELLGRDVAVKEVAPPQGQPGESPEELRRRALREARAAARVGHPCAVTVFDVAEEAGRHWIVMELLPPLTLADELKRHGRLSPDAVARIGLDLLDALSSAHAAGVLHRDVKPSNVLLTDGRAVLADFGIATLDGDAPAAENGLVVGSPAYMAPERARGEAPSPASDLWALGATLYSAVEGRPPFWRDAPLPTLDAVIREDAPPAEHAGPLTGLIAALLARDPGQRPDAVLTRRVLLAVLAAPTVQLPASAPQPTPAGAPLPAPVPPSGAASLAELFDGSVHRTVAVPRQRRRAPLAVACAVTLLGVGGVAGRALLAVAPGLAPVPGAQAAVIAEAPPQPSPSAPAPRPKASAATPTAVPATVHTQHPAAAVVDPLEPAQHVTSKAAGHAKHPVAKAKHEKHGDGGHGHGHGHGGGGGKGGKKGKG